MEPLITVRIDSPEKNIWEGKARSLSCVNSRGPFDILPLHATFVTLVENQPIVVVNEKGESLKFEFARSVIFNRNNSVSVYTNI